jgi:DNA-binding HxlR family transcriptional regulator
MIATYNDDILFMLKVLADDSRLTLLRALHQTEISVGDLARLLDLTEPTVSHHLSRLREAGLVTLRMDGNQRFYRLNESGLARFKRLAGKIELPVARTEPRPPDHSWIDALGWEEAEAQILRDYTNGPRLTHLPNKRKKTEVILRWLATLFEAERVYNEAEVNEVLKSVYADDYVSLRRDLIDFRFLRRESGGAKYWLAPLDAE